MKASSSLRAEMEDAAQVGMCNISHAKVLLHQLSTAVKSPLGAQSCCDKEQVSFCLKSKVIACSSLSAVSNLAAQAGMCCIFQSKLLLHQLSVV